MTIEYAQEVQHPRKLQQPPQRKTLAFSNAPCIQGDDWVEVSGKGKGKAKTFTQAVAAGASIPSVQQQVPAAPQAQTKTYPRDERDLIINTSSQIDITPTLPKLHSIITNELTKYNN